MADVEQSTVELAAKYGPFFFAVAWFVVVKWTYGIYDRLKRGPHKPSESELGTFRAVFIGSLALGVLLVAVAIWAWVANEQRLYLFRGQVRNIAREQDLLSDQLAIKLGPTITTHDGRMVKSVEFLTVGTKPFAQGQSFDIYISRDGDPPEQIPRLHVCVPGDDREVLFDLEFKRELGAYALTRNGAPADADCGAAKPEEKKASLFSWIATLHAAVPQAAPQRAIADRAEDDIQILQLEASSAGMKLAAIKRLRERRPDDLRRLLSAPGTKEPPLLTIFDLTRHPEPELAFNAQMILDSVDATGIVREMLLSPSKQAAGRQILFRLPPDVARRVLAGRAVETVSSQPVTLTRNLERGGFYRFEGDISVSVASGSLENFHAECVTACDSVSSAAQSGGYPPQNYPTWGKGTRWIGLTNPKDPTRGGAGISHWKKDQTPPSWRVTATHVSAGGADPALAGLARELGDGSRNNVLVPTATRAGDRYYVRARWNPSDARATECLAQLFNTELASSRSLADERALMKGRSDRIVWWITKEWVLTIADKIRACGGSAAFVPGGADAKTQ